MIRYIAVFLLAAVLLAGCTVQPTAGNTISQDPPPVSQSDPTDTVSVPDTSQSATVLLTAEQAQTIALEDAGLTADQVTGLRAELDWDDGVREWEVQFYVNRTEYDYDIHAETGAILHREKDLDD